MKFKKRVSAWPFRSRTVILCLLLSCAASNQTRVVRGEPVLQSEAPRSLEVLDVGYQLPVEIVAVRNLQKSEHWIRDLEIEIRNISSKPIYEIYLDLFMPDDKGPGGVPLAVSLEYGRLKLITPGSLPLTEDKALVPGEAAVLRVNEKLWRGYEYHLANENVPEQATYRVRLAILAINFGDGTGFINGGVPYPREPGVKSRPQRYVRIPVNSR